ncbi:conserved hypothetical protein [Leishmania major strain Friedlin]|uniref:Uncharacterized protein n=1 Tax=Leishmania major TaxID=5664 RepID=Q4QIM5_LEIMA|nr:conserved hypothetical protein [Leishmania major strain Friedlin]CAG9569004.1 hypothetical_protein_-_conserved [Leishmania major strain Friedlin]CAJ07028.1 conserved hypothetical protein [Leishmania major strain Friedlin]|eukprot:XP_001680973.1 conserved hypothetical protein [Leishmania major strain Friedlin]
MFLRIRGKGSCPENSQALVMHIRGFRHTHSPPPSDFYYSVLLLPPSSESASSAADAAASTETLAARPTKVMQPFRFPLFPVGIQAAALTALQAQSITQSPATNSGEASGDATTAAAAPPLSPMETLDKEVARMLWRETWNLYDILYDEVPLLPWVETAGDEAAAALVETVERELRELASSDATAATATALHSLASLADKIDNFKLASARMGNRQVVVCPHYYSSAALPRSSFGGMGRHCASESVAPQSATSPMSMEGPVVVLDLADLPIAQAGGKTMVNIAWYTAFAGIQPDSVLLHCRAVVVRLPYTSVPTYMQACGRCVSPTSSAAAAPTMADAFREMVDFVGEHMAAVYQGMLLTLQATSPELAAKHTAAPPVVVVGSTLAALSGCLGSLFGISASPNIDKSDPVKVVVLYGDHLGTAAAGSTDTSGEHDAAEACSAHMLAQYKSVAEAYNYPMTFETVRVPLKALLDGEEEPWDEYTLRERGRLNFCPCCGDCCNDNKDHADGRVHVHGHGDG